jgi:hypothetical protein
VGFLEDLTGATLAQSSLEVRSTLWPGVLRVPLAPQAGASPSPVWGLLRPSVTLSSGGSTVASFAPGGDPSAGFPLWVLVLGVLALWLLA